MNPREGLLDGGGIGIHASSVPLNPAGKGVIAQFPAGSPAQATTGGQSPPVAEMACEDQDRERIFRAPPTWRAHPGRALAPGYQYGRWRVSSHNRHHPGHFTQGSSGIVGVLCWREREGWVLLKIPRGDIDRVDEVK